MSEPVHEVSVDRIFTLLGAKVAELSVVHELHAASQKRVAELETELEALKKKSADAAAASGAD